MGFNGTLYDSMEGIRDLGSAVISGLKQSKLREVRHRMEAGFYVSEGYTSVQAMEESGFETITVGDLAGVTWHGPSARCYVEDPSRGIPFLSSSQMMEARPTSHKFVSRKNTKALESFLVEEGTILISRSGTVGNVALVTKSCDGWAVSEHAIRARVRKHINLGVVYCFLQSALGQFLLSRSKSGSVVDTIYETDVSTLPIPRLPRALREELTRLVKQASALRVEANRLLDEAEEMVQKQLNLPDIEEFFRARPDADDSGATMFTASAEERVFGPVRSGRRRLDATAYDPAAIALRNLLLRSDGGVLLGTLLGDVKNSNLRKRIYVEEAEHGVPLLGGRQLVQLRPSDLNYLSTALTKNLRRERVLLVHRNFEQSVFTQDVMRLVPSDKTRVGFIYAFLTSPYGQLQLQQDSYGSVQKKIREFHIKNIAVALPEDSGASIHEKVISGFDARADAMEVEDQAFDLFMAAVKQGRQTIESEWGDQY
jgi:type I restriction enzyme S subunit